MNSAGNAFVTGSTSSTNFPIANALQPVIGFQGDVFISKFNSTGNALVYSTYLGGGESDSGLGLAVDSEDRVYLTGSTSSVDFPTTNDARQPTLNGSGDTFLTKLSSAGNALIYSSYHGGNASDLSSGITVHSDGSIYVTGLTFSIDFPLVWAKSQRFLGKSKHTRSK